MNSNLTPKQGIMDNRKDRNFDNDTLDLGSNFMVDKDSGRDIEQILRRMEDGSSKKTGKYQPPSNLNLDDYERIQMECRYNSDSKPKIRKSNTHRGHQHETCVDEFVCKKKYKTFGILPEVY